MSGLLIIRDILQHSIILRRLAYVLIFLMVTCEVLKSLLFYNKECISDRIMHYAHPLLYDSKGQLVTRIFLSSRTFHFKDSVGRMSFSFQYVLTAGYHLQSQVLTILFYTK